MAVVLATDTYETVRPVIRRLREQTVKDRLEVVSYLHKGVKVVFDDRGRGRTYRLAADPEENDPRPLAEGASLARAYAAWHQREWNTARAPSADNRRALESMGYVH